MEKSGACLCGAARIKTRHVADAFSVRHCDYCRCGAGPNLSVRGFAGHKPDSYFGGALAQYFDLGVAP